MPKLTLHDMLRVAQAQMRAVLRHARSGSRRAGMAFCPQEPHRLGGRSQRTNTPRRSDTAELRRQVVERAGNCCEYCLLPQELVASTHQVDHVIAEKHDGQTAIENLALSYTM
jgi:HNH endonuclease